jgi:RNA polymerase sigma factor (sigma-70 family)
MGIDTSGIVLRQIRTLWDEGRIGALTDEQLLERFTTQSGGLAEAAFEAIILRHGPMVLGVCRRVLRDPQEVEDGFQATFLILARRAGSIRKREALGGWLCRVAHRLASRARILSARRSKIRRPNPTLTAAPPEEIVEHDDVCAAILGEVQLLPEKYRLPVQLCYLEGRTHDEAALQLAWPVGTVRTRLAWARDRLRIRLSRRGLALSVGVIDHSLHSLKATGEVPAGLVQATLAAAFGRSCGTAAAMLAIGVLRAMLMSRFQLTVILILATGSLAGIALPLIGAGVRHGGPLAESRQDSPPTGRRGDEQEAPTTGRDVRTVFFRVVDRTAKRPLAGVTLKVWVNGKLSREHITDATGRLVIPLPETEPERLTVTARGDGWVPKRVYLRHFAARETEIPRSYTLEMERGTSIGGVVRDGQERPIEGVTVSLSASNPDSRRREAFDFDDVNARTDAQGRWHIDVIPAGFDLGHLHFTFKHADFVSWVDAVNNQSIMTPEGLRSRSGVAVLHKGFPVTGRVLDRDGRPISGAVVRLGDPMRHSTAWVATVKTDSEGRFRIGNTAMREAPLSVQAAGHAPELMSLNIRPNLSPIEFRLGPGHTIRGRVIDDRGRLVSGAGLVVSEWRGHTTLDWRAQSDADGRFRWDDAPGDVVSIAAFKPGYDGATRSVKASDKELVLSLLPSRELRIRGSVTDAESGRPIETFTVVPGTKIGGPTLWHVVFAKVHHGGRYEIDFSHLGIQPHLVLIEAKGYLPATSDAYAHNAGEKVFDVALRKGEWIEGVVRGSAGEPLGNAEVVVVTDQGIHIGGGNSYQREFHPHLVTGPDGRFSFSPPDGPHRIIALHDRGYAEATGPELAERRSLLIEPWGRIEGTLRVGGKTMARETIIASLDDERDDPKGLQVQNESRALTDDNGRFIIERVTPGDARVHWQSDVQSRPARPAPDRYYQPVFLEILPGRTARVDLIQEGGRAVMGRVLMPGAPGRAIDPKSVHAYLFLKVPEVPYPPGLEDGDRREWYIRWRLTEAGRTYRHRRRGIAHTLNLREDGSFRVDEVQPGGYELEVRVPGHVVLTRHVFVPEPTANNNGAIDLGTLSLEKSAAPKTSD